MSRFEWVSLTVQAVTLAAACYFALVQNQINIRQNALNDYVSVSAVPSGGGVKFLNTGAVNVYINSIDVDGKKESYDRPRQIAARAGDDSSYYVPISLETANKKDFSIRLDLTDEFGAHWVSEDGGGSADDDPKAGAFTVWTYRTTRAR